MNSSEKNLGHNVSFSEKNYEYFANSSHLFRLSQRGQNMPHHPTPLVRKIV